MTRQLKNDSIDNLISGNKIIAIFGFVIIKDFQEYTNLFKENVLVFINSLAEIIHETTDEFNGKINKNIGEAFLVVWRIPDNYCVKTYDQFNS